MIENARNLGGDPSRYEQDAARPPPPPQDLERAALFQVLTFTPEGTFPFSLLGAKPESFLREIGAQEVRISRKGEGDAVIVKLSRACTQKVDNSLLQEVQFEKEIHYTGTEIDDGRIEVSDISGVGVKLRILPILVFPQRVMISPEGGADIQAVATKFLKMSVQKTIPLPPEVFARIRESVKNFKDIRSKIEREIE